MKIYYSDYKSLEARVLRAREEAITNGTVIDYVSFTCREWNIIRNSNNSLVIDSKASVGRWYGIKIMVEEV